MVLEDYLDDALQKLQTIASEATEVSTVKPVLKGHICNKKSGLIRQVTC